jgi:hypothetical protein
MSGRRRTGPEGEGDAVLSAKIDITPDYPEQPSRPVGAAERDLPTVLQDIARLPASSTPASSATGRFLAV